MVNLELQQFVKPYPQQALNGDSGLLSTDLAKCLNVSHHHLVEKIKRGLFKEACKSAGWQLHAGTCNSTPGKTGPKMTVYTFDVRAAKAFIAKWNNELGWGYLNFLFECESYVEKQVPLMIAAIKDLTLKVEALSRPKRIPGPGRRHRVVAGFRTITDLWGNDEKTPVYRELAFSEMTDEERRAYESQHLSKISSGASKKAAKLINHEVKPGKSTGKLLNLPSSKT